MKNLYLFIKFSFTTPISPTGKTLLENFKIFIIRVLILSTVVLFLISLVSLYALIQLNAQKIMVLLNANFGAKVIILIVIASLSFIVNSIGIMLSKNERSISHYFRISLYIFLISFLGIIIGAFFDLVVLSINQKKPEWFKYIPLLRKPVFSSISLAFTSIYYGFDILCSIYLIVSRILTKKVNEWFNSEILMDKKSE